jgi:hypothetical protein
MNAELNQKIAELMEQEWASDIVEAMVEYATAKEESYDRAEDEEDTTARDARLAKRLEWHKFANSLQRAARDIAIYEVAK